MTLIRFDKLSLKFGDQPILAEAELANAEAKLSLAINAANSAW